MVPGKAGRHDADHAVWSKNVCRNSIFMFHFAFNKLRGIFKRMRWKKMLALMTGQIEDSLQRKVAYVLEENRAYRALLDRHSPRWRLADTERLVLAE
jgi:hypothetical protein